MKLSVETQRRLSVSAAFLLFMAVTLVVAYLVRDVPTPREACEKKCAGYHMQGELVYHGPAGKGGIVQDLRSECECR